MARGDEQGRRRRRDRLIWLALLAASLVLHATGLLSMPSLMAPDADATARPQRVRMVSLNGQRHAQGQRGTGQVARPGSPTATPKPVEPPPRRVPDDDIVPPGRPVTLPPPEREQEPERADYASQWDQKVERESVARRQSHNPLNYTNRPQLGALRKSDQPSSSSPPKQAVVQEHELPGGPEGMGRSLDGAGPQRVGTGQQGGRPGLAFELPRLPEPSPLQLKLDEGLGPMAKPSIRSQQALMGNGSHLDLRFGARDAAEGGTPGQRPGAEGQRGGSGDDRGEPGSLTPDQRTLQQLAGAPANDYLPGVEQDEGTFLNTWRWKYAAFNDRITDAIRRQWNPASALASRDPTGNIYGFQDRYTLLRVTIDRAGDIQEIVVTQSSGVEFLDREAREAVTRAGPFSNPPKPFFQGRETSSFTFGFFVDFERSPLVQFSWGQ